MNERDSNFNYPMNDKQNEGQPQNVTVPRFVFMLDYKSFFLRSNSSSVMFPLASSFFRMSKADSSVETLPDLSFKSLVAK